MNKEQTLSVITINDEIRHVFDEMSKQAKDRARKETPKNKKKDRPGKGGGTWIYAKSDYFEDCLNNDFPGWSFQVKDWKITGPPGNEESVVNVSLKIIDNGLPRIIEDIGGSEVKYKTEMDPSGNKHKTTIPLSISNDVKAGVTDGFKRCCYRLGYARDLRVDPADMDISEEEFGLVMNAIEKFPKDAKEQIREILYQKVNKSNYKNFVIKQIMPKVKKISPEKYQMLVNVFGDIIV